MTKKEFKEAMLRGLGRCVIAVRQEPEKHRDIVLWACKRNFAYDAQSEGTRSWYTYTMANAYPDKETFINTAAEALKKYRPNGSWDLLHLSEVLMFFAMDGYESARKALEEKYQEVLTGMFARKRRPNRVFHELSDLEQLGLVLAFDRTSFLHIAKDFGRLYQEKKYMCDGDFAWFFSSKGERYRRTMEAAARKDKNVACFMQREQADIDAQEEHRKQRQLLSPETYAGVRLSRWLSQGFILGVGAKMFSCCGARHLPCRRCGGVICRPRPLARLLPPATGGSRLAPHSRPSHRLRCVGKCGVWIDLLDNDIILIVGEAFRLPFQIHRNG